MDLFKKVNRRVFLKSAGKFAGISITMPIIGKLNKVFAFQMDGDKSDEELKNLSRLSINHALEKRMDYCDFFYESVISRHIIMEDGIVSDIDYGVDAGIGIRTKRAGTQAYAYTQSMSRKSIMDTVERACSISDRKTRNIEPVNLKVLPDRGIIPIETDIADLSIDKRIEQMMLAHEASKKVSDIINYIKIDYIEDLRRTVVANSNGVFTVDYQPRVFFIIHCLGVKNGNRHMGRKRVSFNGGFEMFADGFPKTAGETAGREVLNMIDAVPAPAGNIPVVIANGWGGVIVHEAVGHGLEGDAILAGNSYYEGMVGKKVASEHVFMADSGNIRRFRGSYNYDDEGSASTESILIAEGKLLHYMTGIESSEKLKMKNTGNARRQSFRYPPLVRMTNTFLMPGRATKDEIIKDTKSGIFVVEFGGGSVDIITGNYTFSVREGYLIENGEITKPIRGATLIGRGPDSLKKINAVASDLDFAPGICGKGGQFVPVNVGQPTIRVSEMTVGGTS